MLPDAPYVHPALCALPLPASCARRRSRPSSRRRCASAPASTAGERDADLELVALATVADVVALRGENRRLVRAGLRALARTARPGLRALMSVARVDAAAHRRARARLPPRAADQRRRAPLPRRQRARAAADRRRRARARARRRSSTTPTPSAATSRRGSASRPRRRSRRRGPAAAYVLAGAGWHPGVIGIVAARIAERHHRPVVLVALPDGRRRARPAARGARSPPSTCSAACAPPARTSSATAATAPPPA